MTVIGHFDVLASVTERDFRLKVLDAVCSVNGGRWCPQRYGTHDPVKRVLDPAHLDAPAELWAAENIGLVLKRTTAPKYEIDLWGETAQLLVKNQTYLWVDSAHLKRYGAVIEFISLMRALYEALRPAHGFAAMNYDYEAKNRRVYRRDDKTTVQEWYGRDLSIGLRGVYWANWFGPTYVEFFGEHILRTAPSFRGDRLSDGGYQILTAEDPWEPDPDLERRLQEHLGSDAFFDIQSPEKVLRSPWSRE